MAWGHAFFINYHITLYFTSNFVHLIMQTIIAQLAKIITDYSPRSQQLGEADFAH